MIHQNQAARAMKRENFAHDIHVKKEPRKKRSTGKTQGACLHSAGTRRGSCQRAERQLEDRLRLWRTARAVAMRWPPMADLLALRM